LALEEAALDGRQRRRLRTRRALVDSALRLFAERGFDATRVEDITEAAGVSPRTFFHYFASKEAVLYGDHPLTLEELARSFARRPPDEPVVVSIREVMIELNRRSSAERDIHRIRYQLALQTPGLAAARLQQQQEWADLVASWVARRLGLDREVDMRPALIANVCIAAARTAFVHWCMRGCADDLGRLTREAFRPLEASLGWEGGPPPPGRRA
jgi:AcrR family transcriptional regulator